MSVAVTAGLGWPVAAADPGAATSGPASAASIRINSTSTSDLATAQPQRRASDFSTPDSPTTGRKVAPKVPKPHIHTINVWTRGSQTQINECRGGVDLTARYTVRTVGEHWSCGGSSFPTSRGSIVRITGIDAGTYRVLGVVAVLNAYKAHTRDIPRGYSLLYQTCRGGDSHYTEFVGLVPVG